MGSYRDSETPAVDAQDGAPSPLRSISLDEIDPAILSAFWGQPGPREWAEKYAVTREDLIEADKLYRLIRP